MEITIAVFFLTNSN